MSEPTEQKIGLALVKPTGANERKGMGNSSMEMLNAGGVSWRMTARVGFAAAKEIPGLEIWYRKNRNLPSFVATGTEAQLAIVGLDVLGEYSGSTALRVVRRLGFDECNLVMGVTERAEFGENNNREWEGPQDFIGRTIATSYKNGAGKWLDQFNIPWYIYEGGPVASDKVAIRQEDGDTESIVNKGNAQGAYEVVSSGDSMFLNHMKPLRESQYAGLKSEAVLIANPMVTTIPNSEKILLDLFRVVMSGTWQTRYTLLKYNVDMANAARVLEGVPARQSATLMPLVDGGWAAENLVLLDEADKWASFIIENGGREVFHTKPAKSYPNWDDKDTTDMMRAIRGQEWMPTPPPPPPTENPKALERLTRRLTRIKQAIVN